MTGAADNGRGRLRVEIDQALEESGRTLKDLTIQAPQRDPYRLDTPANHRDGEWLAANAERHEDDDPDSTIHLRGLHYKILSAGAIKPNGKAYTNTEEDWNWLSEKAAKAARWLGYIPFDRIHDARNAEPVVRVFERPYPKPYLGVGVEVEIPEAADIQPTAEAYDFIGVQPFKLVLFGEKTSLEPVLASIAENLEADLYLPSGDISDTLLHRIAKTGAEDGRRMVVFTLSDCDPSGWNMPVAIGHKLRAFRDSLYPELDFEVQRVALTPEQVREHGLLSTPLKDTEGRAGKWRAATGLDQTEIDALAALQPDLLRRIVGDALEPFFDASLDRRVREAHLEWRSRAQVRLMEQLDPDEIDRIVFEADAKLEELRDEVDAINDALRVGVGDEIILPEIVVPDPMLDGTYPLPLVASDCSFVEHVERLQAAKAHEEGGER